jgi:hypothetical protein
MRNGILTCMVFLAACSEPPPAPIADTESPYDIAVRMTAEEQGIPVEAAQKELDAEIAREGRIQAIRQNDAAINWMKIGISTGKFSESISTSVHKTYSECVENSWSEDNECVPIPALPNSYWDTGA